MARLDLDLPSLKNLLLRVAPLLVDAQIEHNKLVVTVRKVVAARVRVSCEMNVTDGLLALDLDVDWILRPLLWLGSGTVKQKVPSLVELSPSKCVIDLTRLEFNGQRLADWIDVERVTIPGTDKMAMQCDFSVKG